MSQAMNPFLQGYPRGPGMQPPWRAPPPHSMDLGYDYLPPSVGHEFEHLHSQLAEQESKIRDLKWESIAKVRDELEREQGAANNIRYRMHTEAMNGIAAMYPNQVNAALLRPPGAFRPTVPRPQLQAPPLPFAPYPTPNAAPGPMMRPPLNPFQRPPNGPPNPFQRPPLPTHPHHEMHFQMMSGTDPSLGPSQELSSQQVVEELTEMPNDDPETRHEAVKERCTWLYLKGRLEGFEVLRPELVFDGVAAPRVQGQLSTDRHRRHDVRNATEMQTRSAMALEHEKTREELAELYREGIRRMDASQATRFDQSDHQHAGRAESNVCLNCGTTFAPGARFCRKCGKPRPGAISETMQHGGSSKVGVFPAQPGSASHGMAPWSAAPGGSEDALVHSLKSLPLQDGDGNHYLYDSHRPLEADRRSIFSSAFPQCAEPNEVHEITARGQTQGGKDNVKEFTAVSKKGASAGAELVVGSCQITLEDVSPSDCVEYAFSEEPDRWKMAQLTREALEEYRRTKFQSWLKMLQEPTCEAQLRRMLQIGPVTRLYDPHVFPTPDAHKSQYQVIDDRTGRTIDLPHPVGRLRIWDAAKKRYESIDPQLAEAPTESAKENWWKDTVRQLGEQQGADYISSLAQGVSSRPGTVGSGATQSPAWHPTGSGGSASHSASHAGASPWPPTGSSGSAASHGGFPQASPWQAATSTGSSGSGAWPPPTAGPHGGSSAGSGNWV